MINEQLLRQGLQKLLKDTDTSIRERLADEPALGAALRERHAAAVRAERTESSAKGFNAFADEAITQAAVHWLLGCVFVRFLEDNGWLDERNSKAGWISGPGDRLAIAKGRRTAFLRPDPDLTDRDYILHVFAEVAKLPGVAGLFDQIHNPLYWLQPTGPGVGRIVEFFQKVDPDSNALIHDFTDLDHGTRFLGDLYQNLSESARKRYALCQTPSFVIDFILDRTLSPAIDAFGLENVRIIDPSCGSGHFILEAFSRLFRLWQNKEPGKNVPALVQHSLDAVYGIDLNPFAVEITRFRLLIAAIESSNIARLRDAPNFRFNLAAGDSLLHGSRRGGGIERNLFDDRLQHFYDTEDAEELQRILNQTYHVVVGNPPYINVEDSILREAYRNRFVTCHRSYQLGVPFTERFFDLTLKIADSPAGLAGWIGMIASNAFMKRSFGKKLVENYLANRDLTHVIDTSWVYLPGHGTPTAILLGRNQPPALSTIRAVFGIRGEPGIPTDPAQAPVWKEIKDHVDLSAFEGRLITVSDTPRKSFEKHPWAIGGGGASELKQRIDEVGEMTLSAIAPEIGRTAVLGAEDAWFVGDALCHRISVEGLSRPFVVGEDVREWAITINKAIVYPYEGIGGPVVSELPTGVAKRLWPSRTVLKNRTVFKRTMTEMGKHWYELLEHYLAKLKSPQSIVYGVVVSHNHFVYDRGGSIFNPHAPVIKLNPDASEDQHLEVLGLLNSSTACFWLKQICYPKGGDSIGQEGARIRKNLWDVYYEFDSTKIKEFPLPEHRPLALTKIIQSEVDIAAQMIPETVCNEGVPVRIRLDEARSRRADCLARMISLQEELDWKTYHLYGIVEEDLTLPTAHVPPIQLGERAFEIILARTGEEPLWFERHQSAPISELPTHWPDAYSDLVKRRLAAIDSNRDLALMEKPEYKRRWNLPKWEEMERAALNKWLLNRIEASDIWNDKNLVSCAQLRDALARDSDWLTVADTYNGGPLEDMDQFVIKLALPESVPFLPALRYTDAGLRKRADWEQVWMLQREEDAGVTVEIPVPAKYFSTDFQKGDYWRLRGALDVPKERFILYRGFQRDSDETPVLGWAGWSLLDQARALAAYYQRMRSEEGWEPQRLKPILAGLLDLRAWLKQWHDDLDPETGLKLGTYFSAFAESQCQDLGFSPEEVLMWKPPVGMVTDRRKKSKLQ